MWIHNTLKALWGAGWLLKGAFYMPFTPSPDASKLEVIIFTVNLTGDFMINNTTQCGIKKNHPNKRDEKPWYFKL